MPKKILKLFQKSSRPNEDHPVLDKGSKLYLRNVCPGDNDVLIMLPYKQCWVVVRTNRDKTPLRHSQASIRDQVGEVLHNVGIRRACDGT